MEGIAQHARLVGSVEFPAPKGIDVNMMPIVLDGRAESLPPALLGYAPLVAECLRHSWRAATRGRVAGVGYITVLESAVGAGGGPHRRGGLHTDCPGVLPFLPPPPPAAGDGETLQRAGGRAGGHRWGLSETVLEGGIFMASSIGGSTAIVNARVAAPGDFGDCELMRARLPQPIVASANELWWLTDMTPHESLPLPAGTFRQFFRLVVGRVDVWFSAHSTPSPLGVLPRCHIVDGNKFELLRRARAGAAAGHGSGGDGGGETCDVAYARDEGDRAAVRAARRALAATEARIDDEAASAAEEDLTAPQLAELAAAEARLAAPEARLAASEVAALAAFTGQGGGPCAYTRLGEALIDVLADVAVAGFAAELAPARFLCNETFEIREPGAVADVLRNALEAQCGATAAHAARREDAELPGVEDWEQPIRGTTQLIRAATRGGDARVRTLVALGAPRASVVRDRRHSSKSALSWASHNGFQRIVEDLLGVSNGLGRFRWTVTTLAGSGAVGFADGARAAAQFKWPSALAPLPDGSVVVADRDNHCIRLISAGGDTVSTLAGKGGEKGFADGLAAVARFNEPLGVVVGTDGVIFVADWGNHRVRCIKDGAVTIFAGSGEEGGADGVGVAASFKSPYGLALGPKGVLYVTDDHRVRMISPAGAVTTLAGGGERGFADGRGAAARFDYPSGIAVDAAGVVFVADRDNHCIRRITNGVVGTLAGSGAPGFADGAGAAAQFFCPDGLALDHATGHLLVADHYNNRIRAVDPRSGAVSTLAGSGAKGDDDGDAAAASFNWPSGVAVDAQGGVLVADYGNHRVRRIARAN